MNQSINKLKEFAETAFRADDLVKAQEFYQEILSESPFSSIGLSGMLAVARAAGQGDAMAGDLIVCALNLAANGQHAEAGQCLEPLVQMARDLPVQALEPIIALLAAGGIAFANAEQFDEAEKCCQPLFDRAEDVPTDTLISALDELSAASKSSDALDLRIKCLRELRKFRPSDPDILFQLVNALHGRCWQLTPSDPERAILLAEEAYALFGANDEVLRQLVTLRSRHGPPERLHVLLNEMIARFDRCAPPASQPQGLQELDGDRMTADDLAGALLSDGAVLIRNMLTCDQKDYLLAEIANKPWKLEEQAMLRAVRPVILDGMAIIFGRRPVGLTQGSGVRIARLEDDQSYLFYHQDLVPLCTMGINLWAALDPIDGTRPGLEVIVRRQHHAFPVRSGNIRNSADYEIAPELMQASFSPADFVRPEMAVGDGMMFLFTTVHSSYLPPGMTESRRNMEFRFV